ncbi:MAG TPA: Clp protease ClpP [Spirochaetota bacterium]|nr:Clp protease ClpP [Spirochaetota bacterium]
MKKIIISGEIGWDVQPAEIRRQLAEAKGQPLSVEIASPGGSVFKGIEVFNLFRDYRRDYPGAMMVCTIKGLAASMASYLASCEAFRGNTKAEDNAVFMLHNAWGTISGDYREMQKYADMLDNINNLLASAYVARTGKPLKEIREMMDAETWLYGSEIKDAGFVDEIIPSTASASLGRAAAMTTAKAKFKQLSARAVAADMEVAALAFNGVPGPVDDMALQVQADRQRLGLVDGVIRGHSPDAVDTVPEMQTAQDVKSQLNRDRAALGLPPR